jgi:hypothetical protein
MKKKIVILVIAFFSIILGNFCYAQTLDANATAKEIESLKLKTGQLIDHEEITPINFKTQLIGEKKIIYSYIADEIDSASNIIFGQNDTYSNTEKLDSTHFRIYSAPKYFKDDNNIIHQIKIGSTTPDIWNKASIPTLMDKITSILKTPYAIAGTSYLTDDGYISKYNNTNWYDVRTSAVGDVKAFDRIIAYNWVQYATENGDIYFNFRTPITFDLSLINPTNILSGTINLYSEEADETTQHSYAFFQGTQAFPSSVNDYSSFANNLYTNTIENSDVVSNGFTAWTLNSAGIDYLKTGAENLMFMETMYDVGSTTPPDYLNIENGRSFNSSLSEDYESHPYIELTISNGGATTTPITASGDDIGIIYYNATTTKIDDNITVIAGTYRIPYLLFKYVSIIMAFCFAVLITFFLSFINKKKKL